jgi:hypothetical protein
LIFEKQYLKNCNLPKHAARYGILLSFFSFFAF